MWARAGSRRRNSAITGGSTSGVSSRSHSSATTITSSSSGIAIGSPRTTPDSANTEVPTNDDAATVASTVPLAGRESPRLPWRTWPATYPTTTSASAQRPARWSAGGARSRATPAAKPSTIANCGPRVSAAPTTTSRQRFGTTPCQARCGNSDTWSTSANETIAKATSARSQVIGASSSQRPVRLDDGAVARRTGRDDDADQVERAEVDVRVDHRALRGLTDAAVDVGDLADRHARDIGAAGLAAPGDDRVALGRYGGLVDELEVEAAV